VWYCIRPGNGYMLLKGFQLKRVEESVTRSHRIVGNVCLWVCVGLATLKSFVSRGVCMMIPAVSM
jgi:hypothetical protein